MHYQHHVITKRATVALVGLVFAGGMLAGIGVAHADTDDDDGGSCGVVCTASRLGEDPGTIAQNLHDGDPRYSIWQTQRQVWNDLEDSN